LSGGSFFLSSLPGVAPDGIDPAYRNVRDLPHNGGYRGLTDGLSRDSARSLNPTSG
jgi:hypothetical protein